MKASELRIGNLVQDKTGNVKTISGDTIAEIDGFDDRLLIEPIQLTEEWLLKFGFNERLIDKKHNVLQYFINSFEVVNIRNIFYFHYPNTISVESVHQLQNLYFALTGKELEYDQN